MNRRGPVRRSNAASPAGDDPRRRLLLDLYKTALSAVDGRRCVAHALAQMPRADTAVIAIGKAAAAMMAGARDALGVHLRTGFVVTAPGTEPVLVADARVHVHRGDHPVPGPASLAAGAALGQFVSTLPADLPVCVLVSGGASSLIEDPLPGVTLGDLAALNQWALARNVPISQLNGLRRRLSAIKGGRLAAQLAGRSAWALLISDVPGDDPSIIGSGLVACRAGQEAPLPADLPGRLQALFATLPTPAGATLPTTVVASLTQALDAIEARAHALGMTVQRQAHRVEGLAVRAATELAASLLNLTADVLIAGGETTVVLPTTPGVGGRCQHLALAAALPLQGRADVSLLIAGSDGIDGASVDAGAIVDGGTLERAALESLDADDCLRRADSGAFLHASGDLLHTGPTLTNVGDLMIGLKMTAARAEAIAA